MGNSWSNFLRLLILSWMRILLQNRQHEFLREEGTWIPYHENAKPFESCIEAVEYVLARKLDGINLVMKSESPENDIIIPLRK